MFTTQKTTGFERDMNRLARKNRDVVSLYGQALIILKFDPYNLSHQYKIKKLTDIPAGDGQWRLRIGNYRIRYDISGKRIELHSIKPRKDAYR